MFCYTSNIYNVTNKKVTPEPFQVKILIINRTIQMGAIDPIFVGFTTLHTVPLFLRPPHSVVIFFVRPEIGQHVFSSINFEWR